MRSSIDAMLNFAPKIYRFEHLTDKQKNSVKNAVGNLSDKRLERLFNAVSDLSLDYFQARVVADRSLKSRLQDRIDRTIIESVIRKSTTLISSYRVLSLENKWKLSVLLGHPAHPSVDQKHWKVPSSVDQLDTTVLEFEELVARASTNIRSLVRQRGHRSVVRDELYNNTGDRVLKYWIALGRPVKWSMIDGGVGAFMTAALECVECSAMWSFRGRAELDKIPPPVTIEFGRYRRELVSSIREAVHRRTAIR